MFNEFKIPINIAINIFKKTFSLCLLEFVPKILSLKLKINLITVTIVIVNKLNKIK